MTPAQPIRNHSPATPPQGAASSSALDLRGLWHAVLERLWILVLCVVAGLLLAGVYLIRTPKLYQSHAVMEVDVQDPSPVAEDGTMRMRTMFLASQEAMRTIEQNLRNRSLLARVVRSEQLAEDGGRALLGTSIVRGEETAKTTPRPGAPNRAPALGEPAFTPMEDALGGALANFVKPVIRKGTRLIDLYVTHTDPAMAQRLADSIGREYIRFAVERRSASTQDSLRYLLEEEERLKVRLQKSEAAVAEYKERTPDALQLGGGAASTGSQAGAGSSGGRGGLVEDRLQELNNRLSAARADRLKLEGELKQVEQAGSNVDALVAIPGVATSPAVNERRRDVAQLEATVASLTQRYKDKHPRMMAARAALAEAQAALRREASAAPAVMTNLLEQARTAEGNLETAVKEQEKAALALNKAAIGYQELARMAETDRALYESVLRQIKQTDLTKGVKTSAITVIERATLPGGPISPIPSRALTLGLLAGVAAGVAAVFLLNKLDRSVKTVDAVETLFGMPVLAAVPEVATERGRKSAPEAHVPGGQTYRLVAEAPEGVAAEAFRNLRATLTLLGPEEDRKVFLFTSALPSEGKSFTSANYALSLAQQGHRVLLIDGDLRRPNLHQIFRRVGSNAQLQDDAEVPGIVDCLIGATTLEAAVGAVGAEQIELANAAAPHSNRIVTALGGQLSVLAGGRRSPNPAELLSGPSFASLISEAARLFDRVVIDSAPVLAVADTLLMTPFVQTTCLVVRAAKTSRDAVRRALAMLETSQGRPAGIVLNRLPKRGGTSHFYYYSSPGYGAGGTYGGGTYGKPSGPKYRSGYGEPENKPAASANGRNGGL